MRLAKSTVLAFGLMGLLAACGGSSKDESTMPATANPCTTEAPPADGTAAPADGTETTPPADGTAAPADGTEAPANPCGG